MPGDEGGVVEEVRRPGVAVWPEEDITSEWKPRLPRRDADKLLDIGEEAADSGCV